MIPDAKLNVTGRANWATNIKILDDSDRCQPRTPCAPADATTRAADAHDRQYEKIDPSREFLRCPMCQHWVVAERHAFDPRNLDNKTWCGTCKKNWPVSGWLCKCLKAWHKCEAHAHAPQAARAVRQVSQRTKGRKRKDTNKEVGEHCQRALCRKPRTSMKEDIFCKRTSDICFSKDEIRRTRPRIEASFLSNGLKRKFKHLVNNALS